jgi:hypothetical protein
MNENDLRFECTISTPSQVAGELVLDIIWEAPTPLLRHSIKNYDSCSHSVRVSVYIPPHSILQKRRMREHADETPSRCLVSNRRASRSTTARQAQSDVGTVLRRISASGRAG